MTRPLEEARKALYEKLDRGEDPSPFYNETVWPLLLALWREDPPVRPQFQPYEVSIHTVGTSPEATILAILGTRAERVYLLHTEESEKYLERIRKESGRAAYPIRVDRSDAASIYKEVARLLAQHRGARVALDPTGGTKAMTSGLAAAAFFLQRVYPEIQVVYVDNEGYDPRLRRPIPGTEYLVRLPNPYEVLGDVDEHLARTLYQEGEFKKAADYFHKAARKTGQEGFRLYGLLASTYQAWKDLDFSGARRALESLLRELDRDAHLKHPLNERRKALEAQQKGLTAILALLGEKNLSDKEGVAWLAATLLSGYEGAKAHLPLAALYAYRALELLLQHLALGMGLDPDAPHFAPGEEKALRDTLEALLPKGEEVRIPDRFGLLHLLAYLKAKDHPALKAWDPKRLQGLQGALRARNKALLVHGLESPKEGDVEQVAKLARELLKSLGVEAKAEPIPL
ncbi:TIGR02710 family CRISPR-associated protein [Thermus sp.]|uniref:TIGR02710 family CRISPR-associated protein n=1 Tax=Thermus sp. TaxID=275 RepID=UPI00307F1E9A